MMEDPADYGAEYEQPPAFGQYNDEEYEATPGNEVRLPPVL